MYEVEYSVRQHAYFFKILQRTKKFYMVHWISNHETPLTLVIQRKAIKGQLELEADESVDSTERLTRVISIAAS